MSGQVRRSCGYSVLTKGITHSLAFVGFCWFGACWRAKGRDGPLALGELKANVVGAQPITSGLTTLLGGFEFASPLRRLAKYE